MRAPDNRTMAGCTPLLRRHSATLRPAQVAAVLPWPAPCGMTELVLPRQHIAPCETSSCH